jgi:hypothetical protein
MFLSAVCVFQVSNFYVIDFGDETKYSLVLTLTNRDNGEPSLRSVLGAWFVCSLRCYCLIFEARATKAPAQAKKREKKHLTPVGLNADKLPPDSLTLSNINTLLELFGLDDIAGQ